ncbi:MAG: NrdJb [Halieaceae bacterium]
MSRKIDQEIIDFEVASKAAEPAAEDHAVVQMHEKLERPEILVGSTYKLKTPLSEHAFYITINDIILNPGTEHELRRPFEIFINSKNMEHFQWVVALTRVISAVFRKGGDVTFLAEELKAVFDPQGGYFKRGRFMPSLVAELGEAIEDHMKRIGLIVEKGLDDNQRAFIEEKQQEMVQADDNNPFPESAQLCHKCHHKAVVFADGCMTCLNCGDSKCS